MAMIALSILVAVMVGYAAQSGGLCVVAGIVHVVDGHSARTFLSFFRCSLWAALVAWPLWWLWPGAHPAFVFGASSVALLGGLLFGMGAAINGGCSFGTLTRLATGDLSFLVSVAGVAAGAALQCRITWPSGVAAFGAVGSVAHPSAWSLGLLILIAMACLRDLELIRSRAATGSWPPENAVVLVGAGGALLYGLNGPWLYILVPSRLIGAAGPHQLGDANLATLSLATVAGAAICACQDRTFTLRMPWRSVPRRIAGGVAMGLGGALIPGGNGVLVLQGLPALSPHAVPSYAALVVGASTMLLGSRALRRAAHLPN